MSYGSRKRSYDQEGCVRGVDLRLRRITSSPSQTLRRRLVRTTNDGRHRECLARRRPSRLYFAHFVRDSYGLQHCAAIFVQNRVFCIPHLHSTPSLGGFPSEYRHPVWHGKTRMAWLPDGKNISKISLFVLAQLTNVTDGQTDGHGMPAIAALMHSIARQILRCRYVEADYRQIRSIARPLCDS